MIDRYTKAVLTVIALMLIGIVAGQAIPGAKAQRECGSDPSMPCYLVVLNCSKAIKGVGYQHQLPMQYC